MLGRKDYGLDQGKSCDQELDFGYILKIDLKIDLDRFYLFSYGV